jgi:hypothetical protein
MDPDETSESSDLFLASIQHFSDEAVVDAAHAYDLAARGRPFEAAAYAVSAELGTRPLARRDRPSFPSSSWLRRDTPPGPAGWPQNTSVSSPKTRSSGMWRMAWGHLDPTTRTGSTWPRSGPAARNSHDHGRFDPVGQAVLPNTC